jgi:uncharacterized protein involved in tolerance to divalent cations
MNSLVELVLSCGSWQEAQAIADSLLEKKLIASAEFLEQHEREGVKLIMQSAENLYESVQAEIALLRGDSVFALERVPAHDTGDTV